MSFEILTLQTEGKLKAVEIEEGENEERGKRKVTNTYYDY